MVFIIQNTQNRDSLAVNLNLNALMHKQHITDEDLIDAEDESDQYLEFKKNQQQKRSRAAAKK